MIKKDMVILEICNSYLMEEEDVMMVPVSENLFIGSMTCGILRSRGAPLLAPPLL